MLTLARHLRRLTGRFAACRRAGSWRTHNVALGVASGLALAVAVAGCTITLPSHEPVATTPVAAINSATLDQYREAVAKRITERNPSYVLRGTPQAMLRSLVVVSFTVDRNGHVVES
ncbi:MAG TPA: energy transducer TonB, partial [Paraburkholderia sp.]